MSNLRFIFNRIISKVETKRWRWIDCNEK